MPRKNDGYPDGESRRPFYFLVVFIIFVITSLIYLGIYSYSTFFLNKQLDTVDKKSSDIQEEISKIATSEELSTVSTAVTKGKSIRSLLSAHLYESKIFELLEKLSIKSVSYNKFSEEINADNTIKVSITGEAESFKALAKQLVIFKKFEGIKEITFNEATVGKNAKVSFSIVLNFDSKLITIQPVITLVGPNLVKITVGSDYSDAGATASDGIEGPLKVTTTGSVNTKVIGTYTLTYSAVNAVGNSQTLTRIINVVAP